MGANFCSHRIVAADLAEATRKAEQHQQAESHEYGHGSYGGHLGTVSGVTFVEERFDSTDAAYEFASENHPKWEPPFLMRCDGDNWLLAGAMPS